MVWPAVRAFSPTTSLAVLLSASANPERGQPQVVQIADVEEALRLGADAVVLFTALAGSAEADMIRTLAAVGREAERLALPLIAGAEFPTTYASVAELKNVGRALSLARHLQFGTVWINDHLPLVAEMPWTGMKQSGYGRDMSKYAFEDYTQLKHVMAKLA